VQGRADLVGDLGGEEPDRRQLLRLLDLALEAQPLLRLLEQRHARALEILGHPVELLRQLPDLIGPPDDDALAEIAAADRARRADQRADRTRDAPPDDGERGEHEERDDEHARDDALADRRREVALEGPEAVLDLDRRGPPVEPLERLDVPQDLLP